MPAPRLLDLYCGGGGAADGYIRAGFEVVGVDIVSQPGFPGRFVQGDALEFLERFGSDFDVIHASPPCQAYSSFVTSRSSKWVGTKGKDEPKLIEPTRELLIRSGRPWILENVIGARESMGASLLLCGTMFGLPISRHRIFEASHLIINPDHPKCAGVALEYGRPRGWTKRDVTVSGKGRHSGTSERWRELMGIDRPMLQRQLVEAIPPAYSEYIGTELRRLLESP